MKTNKALRSRVKVTRNGKMIVRGKGHGHGNTKESRSKQLNRKRNKTLSMPMSAKTRKTLLSKAST